MVALSKVLILLGVAVACASAGKSTTTTRGIKKTTTTHVAKKTTTTHFVKTTTTPVKKPTTTTKPPKKTPAPPVPSNSPEEMSQVVDCQTQCISLTPPFGHPPDINVKTYMKVKDYGRLPFIIKNIQPIVKPCFKNLLKLKGQSAKVTEDSFNEYVLCNSKTMTKNEDVYFAKNYNWKKNFTSKEWTQFRNHTLPGFRRALHKCRGGCRRIHFAHKGPPSP